MPHAQSTFTTRLESRRRPVMAIFATIAAAADVVLTAPLPIPDPSATSEVDADLVTPGLWGFLTLFLSALAVYFLGRSMARRVQRVNHRARLAAASGLGNDEGEPDPAADESPDATDTPDPRG